MFNTSKLYSILYRRVITPVSKSLCNSIDKTTTTRPETPLFTEKGEISAQYLNDIREVLRDFMHETNITYPNVEYDEEFARSCHEVALEQGFQPEIVNSKDFQDALQASVGIATTTYAHLENLSTRQYVCLYTTCMIYFDDLARTDASSVREFQANFLCGRPQLHPLLDNFADLLRKSWEHFLPACANLVVTSSLDFVTGLILDYDNQEMEVNSNATGYPRWFRTIMGVATAYSIFIFPPDIPFDVYVQIVPDMVNLFCDINDIFSFYKEEAVQENTNHISLLAQLGGKSKLQCMKDLSKISIDGSRRCEAVLATHPKALEIFTNHFMQGYVGFHSAARQRYRLDDLNLE